MHVHTLQLTDEELRLLQASVHSWVNTFTHDQPELLHRGKLLRERLDDELAVHDTPPSAGAALR
jgi:hypothetical protein